MGNNGCRCDNIDNSTTGGEKEAVDARPSAAAPPPARIATRQVLADSIFEERILTAARDPKGADQVQRLLVETESGPAALAEPLRSAVEEGHHSSVKFLLEAKADVSKEEAEPPLLCLGAERGDVEVMRCLLEARADPDHSKPDDGTTALYVAAQRGYDKVVEQLISSGASVHRARNKDDATPLFMASALGHAKVTEQLLAAGGDVHRARTTDGAGPVYVAAQFGHTEVLRKLLVAGGDVHRSRFDSGATPLYVAVCQGHDEVVKSLLEAQANPNRKKDNGQTPLTAAAEAANLTAVRMLMDSKADVNALGFRLQESALDCAQAARDAADSEDKKQRASSIIEILVEAGAKPSSEIPKPQIREDGAIAGTM